MIFSIGSAIIVSIYIVTISGFLWFLFSMHKSNRNYKLALEVISLYNRSKTMTMRECYEARHLLDYATGKIDSKFITSALAFIKLRERDLKQQGEIDHVK